MNYTTIVALLEKYWEGETSLEEERLLKTYFASGRVDERLRREAALFQVFRTEKEVELKTSARIVALPPQAYSWTRLAAAASVALLLAAAAWWLFRPGAATLPEAPPVAINSPSPLPTASPAAPVAEPAATSPTPRLAVNAPAKRPAKARSKTHKTSPEETIEDPEQALAEVKAALALVSSKLNRGKSEAAKGLNHVEAVDILFKKKEG